IFRSLVEFFASFFLVVFFVVLWGPQMVFFFFGRCPPNKPPLRDASPAAQNDTRKMFFILLLCALCGYIPSLGCTFTALRFTKSRLFWDRIFSRPPAHLSTGRAFRKYLARCAAASPSPS